MNSYIRVFVFVPFLIANALHASPPDLRVGQQFPDLILPSLDGQTLSLSDFRGEKVILHIFASW